jgi:predicted DNA binding CopG/RHH family protein
MKTKKRVSGNQFGPEPHQFDPYDAMTNKEFEAEVIAALDAAKKRQKAISIKLPEALLERTREEAKRRGVPYQSLMKVLIDQGVRRLERTRRGSDS